MVFKVMVACECCLILSPFYSHIDFSLNFVIFHLLVVVGEYCFILFDEFMLMM